MNVTDKICEKARDLPEPLAREVLEAHRQKVLAALRGGIVNIKGNRVAPAAVNKPILFRLNFFVCVKLRVSAVE